MDARGPGPPQIFWARTATAGWAFSNFSLCFLQLTEQLSLLLILEKVAAKSSAFSKFF
jgi:hypothetical protein